MIMVCAQVVKNETKREWKHPYISIAKGMKSSPNVHSMYDCVFSWPTIIVACVLIVNVHCTISMWVGSVMIMVASKVK
jgi:hypothetical protein